MIFRDEILITIEANRDKIKKLGVERIAVFGSFARNKQRKNSDVDVLVEFEPGEKTFDNFMDLRTMLQKLLGRRIDLVTPKALKPAMKSTVLNGARYARL